VTTRRSVPGVLFIVVYLAAIVITANHNRPAGSTARAFACPVAHYRAEPLGQYLAR